MPYGILKCDTVTFTNDGADKSVSISGLVQNPTFSGNVTVTGTLSGVTVTGTTASFTSGNFTNISGGTHTITSGVFAAGSAANPSISFTSDPNTGIYSPGADQVAISTNGTGRLFVDSSGRVGIGTSSPNKPLQIYSGSSDAEIRLQTNSGTEQNAYITLRNSGGNLDLYSVNGAITLNPANTERLRITSDGKVGLGTSSPSDPLHIAVSGANSANIRLQSGDGRTYNIGSTGSGYGSSGKFIIYDITAGAERFCINSSGNVGVGTTSPQHLLDCASIGRFTGSSNSAASGSGIEIGYNMGSGIGFIQSYNRGSSTFLDTAVDGATVRFQTSATERARIDSSGRLLVGTSSTSSASALVIENNSSGNGVGVLRINYSTASPGTNDTLGVVSFGDNTHGEYASVAGLRDGGTWSASSKPTRLVFSTTADGASSPTERMRISNGGKIYANTTADPVGPSDVIIHAARTSGNAIGATITTAGYTCYTVSSVTNGYAMWMYNTTASANVGSILVNTSSVSYTTTSDYRLKENVNAVTDGIARLQQLKPSRFNFIADPDTTVDGFIAHEVQAVVPEAITGKKDAVDADGNPIYQGIDQSKLVPLLTAALQEAIGEIESLKARVAALEGA